MKRSLYLIPLLAMLFAACEQQPTLQKYFVKNSEKKNFVTVDIAPSFIQTDSLDLTEEEQEALKSLHKLNVLFLKADGKNQAEVTAETKNVKALLKTDNYEELMKMSSGEGGFSINTKGEGEHIEEFVVFAHSKDTGFGVIRVLGEDMNPTNVVTMAGLLQKANFDMAQLKPLQDMMKKK